MNKNKQLNYRLTDMLPCTNRDAAVMVAMQWNEMPATRVPISHHTICNKMYEIQMQNCSAIVILKVAKILLHETMKFETRHTVVGTRCPFTHMSSVSFSATTIIY